MKVVMVAGKFDPLHDGHIEHIRLASKLADYTLVSVQSDESVKNTKGLVNIPLWARIATASGILKHYQIEGGVVSSEDEDGLSVLSLMRFKPDIFAKGGDRTPDNMPQEETEVCKELGIEIIYGVGRQLNASSKMVMK